MKILFNQILSNPEGDEMSEREPRNEAEAKDQTLIPRATLGKVCILALRGTYEGEQSLGEDAKRERYVLEKKIGLAMKRKVALGLTSEETTLLKSCVAKGFGEMLYGTILELIDEVEAERIKKAMADVPEAETTQET